MNPPQQPDLILEEYQVEMPEHVQGIVRLVEATLIMGGVQEIRIRNGEPISIKRHVRRESRIRGIAPSVRSYSQELRTVQRIDEVISEGATPQMLLTELMARASAQDGLVPVGIFCRNRSWFFRELFPGISPEARLLGLEVFEVDDLPGDVVLIGASAAEGLPLVYAVKAVLDLAEVEETPTFGRPEWRA